MPIEWAILTRSNIFTLTWRDLRVAVQFLTVLPVKFGANEPPLTIDCLGRAVRWYPWVGLGLGGLLVGLDRLLRLSHRLPDSMVSLLTIVALLLLTGMLHFDGFLDCCDGLLAPRSPERRLEIMRDSRVGSFAVGGGWALLSLKWVALLSVPDGLREPALVLGPLLGRWTIGLAVVCFPYGREEGLGVAYRKFTSRWMLGLNSVGVLGVAIGLMGGWGIGLVGGVFGVTIGAGYWMTGKLGGGLTGDCYGALVEAIEGMTWLMVGLLG
jgi:adenosylcobinamide-GDP ribazoletransferase